MYSQICQNGKNFVNQSYNQTPNLKYLFNLYFATNILNVVVIYNYVCKLFI